MIPTPPAGDIALFVAEAKRLAAGQFEIADGLKAWHLNVLVQPATGAVIDSIFVRSADGAMAPANLVVNVRTSDGPIAQGTFTSDAARSIVEEARGFQVVAEMPGGQRSCDVSSTDRFRLGL